MKRLIYPALLLLLAACGKVDVEHKAKMMNLELKAPTPAQKNVAAISDIAYDEQKPEQPKESTHEVSKKIIKEGDISFETNNIRQTRNILCSSLSKLGGYVGEEKESNNSDNNRKEYNLNVRIPSGNFDQFLNGVVSIAEKIDSKNIRRTDVTTEYIDITTQLANKKILEGRYLELLKKANKMADMLEIENKLTESVRT